jgi:transposase-like protein
MRQYTPEFRQSAVNLVLVEGLSARKAAENLGIPVHPIYSWVASARHGTGGLTSPTASDPTARLRELEAQHQISRIECSKSSVPFEWLARAVAQFFAKEHPWSSCAFAMSCSQPMLCAIVVACLWWAPAVTTVEKMQLHPRVHRDEVRLRQKCAASTSEVAACMDLRAFMLNFASGRFMSTWRPLRTSWMMRISAKKLSKSSICERRKAITRFRLP